MQFLSQPSPLSPEVIDDRVATVLEAGTNVTLNYDDAANILTINASPGGSGYTDEQAQDAVGTILQDSATIDYVYNDATPYITGLVKDNSITEAMLNLSDNTTKNSSTSSHGLLPKLPGGTTTFLRGDGTWIAPPTGTTYTDEQAMDAVAAMLTAGGNIVLNYNDAANTLTISANTLDTEQVQDTVAAMLAAGTNITLSYNDAANTLTINSTSGGLDTEGAQDAIGTILTDTSTIDFTYNDTTPSIVADVKDASITEAKLLFADNTTQDVSITKHGLVPKAPNIATQFLDGTGAWSTPVSGVTSTGIYDLGGTVTGTLSANQILLRYPFPHAVDFPAGLTSSQGNAVTAATAQTDIDIRKNGTSFGTMRFAASGTIATFIAASAISFAVGDIISLHAPASPDATLATIGFSLAGTKGVVPGEMGATNFLGLTDTPNMYTNQATNLVRVNTGATALEFYVPESRFLLLGV